MSRARRGAARAAALGWLASAVVLVAVVAGCGAAVGRADPVSDRGAAASRAALEITPAWLCAAALAALVLALLLTRAHVQNARYRHALEALGRQARLLDTNPAGPVGAPADGLGAEVSAAMSLSALRMQTQLTQERAFSGQAAHQLRTPLTALGLTIEELTLNPETPRHLRADLHRCRNEVDRLAVVIADLLVLARRSALPPPQGQINPSVVAVHATDRWASSAKAAGRRLRVTGSLPDCRVAGAPGPAAQVLDVLIDNALKHGSGDIEVSVAVVDDNSVRVRVADQGLPRPQTGGPDLAGDGEGIGLRVAAKLATACGGQMVRAKHPTTAFDLVLPRQATTPSAAGVTHDAIR